MSDTKKPIGGRSAAEQRAQHLKALEAEKAGYDKRGLKDRSKQVDEQIRALTSNAKPKPEGSTERADDETPSDAATKPRGRAAKRA